MGRPRQWTSEAARKAARREQQKLAVWDAGEPWEGLAGDEREQAIRDHFGYGPSESRTQMQRFRAAAKMAGLTVEGYIAGWLKVRREGEQAAVDAAISFVPTPGPRQDRAIAHARWHFHAYQRGEVMYPPPRALPAGLEPLPVKADAADYRKRDLAAFKDKP